MFKMLRRKPTRIELKLDDLEEFEAIKREKELELKKQKAAADSPMSETIAGVAAAKPKTVPQRIGFDPSPVAQPNGSATFNVRLHHI